MIDHDINFMTRTEAKHALQALRDSVRKHRDAKGHDLCWLNNLELYGQLPEQSKVEPSIPAWGEFMTGCVNYRQGLNSHPSQEQGLRGMLMAAKETLHNLAREFVKTGNLSLARETHAIEQAYAGRLQLFNEDD